MKRLLLILTLLFSSVCFGETLVISSKLQVEYPKPLLIANGEGLIFRYKDWWFSHEIVNPKNFYPKIDLTGIDKIFIKAIFTKKVLPAKWLNELAIEQANEFGVTKSNVEIIKIDNAEIMGVYDKKDNQGQIFIIEDLIIHNLYINGSKDKFELILSKIKGR
jgi:hypothetical protein